MKIILIAMMFFALLAPCVIAQVNLDSGLIAYYPFNGNAEDASGNLNHGWVNSVPLTTDLHGNPDQAYEFNGITHYIQIANSASLESPSTEITMTAWVNVYGWSKVGIATAPILMKSNSNLNEFQYRFDLNSSGLNVSFNNWNNGSSASYALNFNEWYMVTASFKVDSVWFYVNDSLIATNYFPTSMTPSSLPLEIGRDVPGSVEVFNGKLDEVRIYARSLTAAEVDALYQQYMSMSVERRDNLRPSRTGLSQNFPNPFNPDTRIEFSLQTSSHVLIEIFDVLGRRTKTLVDDIYGAGNYTVPWRGTDDFGNSVASGVYFYRLTTKGSVETRRMLLLR